jgi:membrane protease YdiL (CAAX protease family)
MGKKILGRTGMQIYLAILFSVIGPLIVMLVNKGFDLDMSKLQKAIIAFTVTSASILFLFPRVFKIPFGKQAIWEWLRSVGVFVPSGVVKQILLGILLGVVSLTGMYFGSHFTGKFEFNWSNLSLGHFVFSLTPGIWEEIMFRGVLMIILIRHYRSISKAFWLQTVIFALCHITGFTLEALFEVISVFIIGITFSFVALRTRALIAGIVYHYIHDAFLFLVQNPNGEYFGFADNATFYIFLWTAMLVNLMLVVVFTKNMGVKSPLSPYEFDGIVDSFKFFEPSPKQTNRAN